MDSDVDVCLDDHRSKDSDYVYKNRCFPSNEEFGMPINRGNSSDGCDLYELYRNPFQELREHAALEMPPYVNSSLSFQVYEGRSLMSRRRLIHSPGLQLEGFRYGTSRGQLDPYSPMCMVPLPDHFGEPCFIRRRNERERERVRCVNEGYSRLKEHLPCHGKERRMSKVDTLRGAIRYIRQLQRLLEEDDEGSDTSRGHGGHGGPSVQSLVKIRTASLSSSEPDSPDSST